MKMVLMGEQDCLKTNFHHGSQGWQIVNLPAKFRNAHFKENRKPSQHDRRERLSQPNPDRKATVHARFPLIGGMATLVAMMQRSLDSRTAFRFSILFAGMMLAKGRRTVSSWFRGAGVLDDWDKFYEALQSVGK